MEPSGSRDRLSDGIFIPTDVTDPFGRLEDALQKAAASEPLERKLREAARKGRLNKMNADSYLEEGVQKGIITSDEADILRLAESARREVITVDDFPHL